MFSSYLDISDLPHSPYLDDDRWARGLKYNCAFSPGMENGRVDIEDGLRKSSEVGNVKAGPSVKRGHGVENKTRGQN